MGAKQTILIIRMGAKQTIRNSNQALVFYSSEYFPVLLIIAYLSIIKYSVCNNYYYSCLWFDFN